MDTPNLQITKSSDSPIYESPRIERVRTPEDMEREVMFAGPGITLGDQELPVPG